MSTDIIEILNEELTNAINEFTVEEGEDEQEKLVTLIAELQLNAFSRGLDMTRTAEDDVLVVPLESDAVKSIVVALMEGSGIKLVLRPSDN